MTKQVHEDNLIMMQPIEPLRKRNILTDDLATPVKTLTVGVIISSLCVFMIPVYGMTYVSILMPICILTAITQISISIIRQLAKHSNNSRNPMR